MTTDEHGSSGHEQMTGVGREQRLAEACLLGTQLVQQSQRRRGDTRWGRGEGSGEQEGGDVSGVQRGEESQLAHQGRKDVWREDRQGERVGEEKAAGKDRHRGETLGRRAEEDMGNRREARWGRESM
jgi:hypothetical protein